MIQLLIGFVVSAVGEMVVEIVVNIDNVYLYCQQDCYQVEPGAVASWDNHMSCDHLHS